MSRRRHLLTLVLFIALAILHTWPLAASPARYWLNTGDYKLNTWALGWIAHQLPRDPARLFHANIFYPEPWTLAFSEHLLPQAVFAVPVIWLGGPPHVGYNISLIAGFALTGWATAILIGRWTGSVWAGVLAGCVAAFNARSMTAFAHLQSLHVMYLPLALLTLDRLIVAARLRHAVATGVLLALQALTSSYWVVYTAIAATLGTLVRLPEWWPWGRKADARRSFRRVGLLAAAAVTAVVLLAPMLYPYWQVREAHSFRRPLRDAAMYSAKPADYLRGSSRLHLAVARHVGPSRRHMRAWLFPGFTAVALTGLAIGTGVFWRDRRARMLFVIGAVGFVLSFGPFTPFYRWLYDLGLLQNMRVASRFGALVFVAVAGLAGFGLAWLLRCPFAVGRAPQAAIGALAVLLVTIESARAPIRWDEFQEVSRVYRVLAAIPDAVIVEVPFPVPRFRALNSVYLPAATVHWKPMVNGYSGLLPASYVRLWRAGMDRFPLEPAIQALRTAGVTHAVVHRDRLSRGSRDRIIQTIDRSGEFELLVSDGEVRLYRLLKP